MNIRRKWIVPAIFLGSMIGCHEIVSAETQSDVLVKYRNYLLTHEMSDYLWKSQIMPFDSSYNYIENYYLADIDNDMTEEMIIGGPSASGNRKIGIIDIVDGKAQCVYSEWGSIKGIYWNEAAQEYGLAIWEGNGADYFLIGQFAWYDSEWNQTILTKTDWEEGVKADYWNEYGEKISAEEADRINGEISEVCIPIDLYAPLGQYAGETSVNDIVESLEQLILEASPYDGKNADDWYYISYVYEPGIAIREKPDKNSELLCRIPYGTAFYVEGYDSGWGCTTINEYSGWTDLDYSTKLVSDQSLNGAEEYSDGEYILADSDSRYISSDEIAYMSAQELCYARNEIFARHGRKFKSSELMDYFNSQDWYLGIYEPEVFPNEVLNDYENSNVQVLLAREYEICPGGYVLD